MFVHDKHGRGGDIQIIAVKGDGSAFKQGKIVGMQKSCSMNSLDSSLIEVNLRTPLAIVGYSEKDVKKVREKYPYMGFYKSPAGSIVQLPKQGEVIEEIQVVGAIASSDLPEDVGYEIIKAYVEGFKTIEAAYSGVKGWDPVGDTFRMISEGSEIPIHAGLYKYCVENGIEVPEYFIPPESK